MARSLDEFARVSLAHLPTPMEPMPRLTEYLTKSGTGPALWIKRDDQTGLAFGGNKTRKLEFLMADALAQGADTVITAGVTQSNHVRQTAAAAAKLGLACHLVLFSDRVPDTDPDYDDTGNIFLDRLLGATTEIHPFDVADRNHILPDVADRLRAEGRKPYVVPYGGSNVIGTLGCVQAAQEIAQQARERNLAFQAVIVATGSAGTQSGFVVGMALAAPDMAVIGVDIEAEPDRLRAETIALSTELAETLEVDIPDLEDRIIIDPDYAGPAYGVPTEATREALLLAARQEGLILDPVYTGKAFAGLIGRVRKELFDPKRPVLFVHTGGAPALFAYRSLIDDQQR